MKIGHERELKKNVFIHSYYKLMILLVITLFSFLKNSVQPYMSSVMLLAMDACKDLLAMRQLIVAASLMRTRRASLGTGQASVVIQVFFVKKMCV